MKKGFIGGFAGAFTAVILVVIVLFVLFYLFAPKFIPHSPCLLDSNCEPQRVCCTWRCDSTELDWWRCPDSLCSIIGGDVTEADLNCGCDNLKCKHVEPSEEESSGFLGLFSR